MTSRPLEGWESQASQPFPEKGDSASKSNGMRCSIPLLSDKTNSPLASIPGSRSPAGSISSEMESPGERVIGEVAEAILSAAPSTDIE